MDVMVDLETLGTTPGCVILSIGAVAFDRRAGSLEAEFYVNLDPASCEESGLRVNPQTVEWWSRQSAEARAALETGQVPLAQALADFTAFFRSVGGRTIWGHGATFDPPVLEAAYRVLGLNPPWKYWAVRDTRTLYELADVAPDRNQGVHHNALADALSQARAACRAFEKLLPA